VLTLPVKAPFNNPLHFPDTADARNTKIDCYRDFAYTVEETRLRPWTSPLSIGVRDSAEASFHIADRKFGWIIRTADVQPAKRLVETLLALGVVPDFTRINVDVNFRFFFNVSSKDVPAYYEIDTRYSKLSFCQEIRVDVFCRQNPPDAKVMKNIIQLDEALYTLFTICGIPTVTW